MLHHLAHDITIWLHLHPEWGGVVTFLVALLESLAIIGVFVPALFFFTAIGALVSSGILPLTPILIWAFAGAVIGDGTSYLLGYRYHEKLQNVWPFSKYRTVFDKGKRFFKKHGGKSVFVSRFIGPLRAIMPMVAGMMNMKPQKFFLVNIPSAVIWSPFYMSGGFLLGAAATSLSPHWGQHLSVVLGCALVVIGIVYFTLRWLISSLHHRVHDRLFQFKIVQRVFHNAIDFNHAHQIFLGLWGIVFSILFFALLLLVMNHFGIAHINAYTHHFFLLDRNPVGDKFFLWITLLGQKQILLPWMMVIVIYLVVIKNFRLAKYLLGLTIVASLTIYFMKIIIHYPRPGGLVVNLSNYSFPSGHVLLTVTLYGFLSYLITSQLERQYQRWAHVVIAALVSLVAMSRLYLGAHWLTDVVGSALLGLIILLMFIISYRRKPITQLNFRWFIPVVVISFMLIYGFYAYRHFADLLAGYQPVHAIHLLPGPVIPPQDIHV